jgi:hypothetical protein
MIIKSILYMCYAKGGLNVNRLDLLALGALPMANVLAVDILIALWRRGSRPFLLGFVAFGTVALALYLLVWTVYAHYWVRFYIFRVLNPLRKDVVYLEPLGLLQPVINGVVVVLLGWPQMAFALIGGFLSRRLSRAKQPD